MNRKIKELALVLNLPSEIIIDIFSRLPIRTILSCKCVCKKWQEQISTLEFAEFHLSRSTPGLIVTLTQQSETLCRMFEIEDEVGLQHHDLHYKPVMKFDPNTLNNSPNANTWMECSVNGLICFRDWSSDLDAIYVCNPITREYIPLPLLPWPRNDPQFLDIVKYGFGVSVLSGQYKVVRIFHEHVSGGGGSDSHISNLKIVCTIYTLGTNSWRSIEPNEVYEYDVRPSVGAFLKGSLHWLVGDANSSQKISCFDLETELFKPFPPPFPSGFPLIASLTVVGNYLCFCNYILDEEIDIWMMKEYGVQESWTKDFVISLVPGIGDAIWGLNTDTFCVLKVFRDGDILMLKEGDCMFYHCNKTGTYPEIEMFKRDRYGSVYAVLHTPSFVSLKSFVLENVSSF